MLLRGEELVELRARDLRTYVQNKVAKYALRFGQSGAEQASAAPEAARVASRCGQPRPTGPGYTVVRLNRPLRPCFRHSLRTKLAHKRLDPVACDQPLLLRDDVGEDLLAALAHLV